MARLCLLCCLKSSSAFFSSQHSRPRRKRENLDCDSLVASRCDCVEQATPRTHGNDAGRLRMVRGGGSLTSVSSVRGCYGIAVADRAAARVARARAAVARIAARLRIRAARLTANRLAANGLVAHLLAHGLTANRLAIRFIATRCVARIVTVRAAVVVTTVVRAAMMRRAMRAGRAVRSSSYASPNFEPLAIAGAGNCDGNDQSSRGKQNRTDFGESVHGSFSLWRWR